MDGIHFSQQLTPRSPKVLLHCMKPSHEKACKVPNLGTQPKKSNPEKRQRKCQQILQKENDKVKKSRQKDILIQKLQTRLGRDKRTMIVHHVNEYVDHHSPLPPDVLSIIEKIIIEQGSVVHAEPVELVSVSEDGIHDIPPSISDSNPTEAESSPRKMSLPPGSEWKALRLYQSLQDSDQSKQKNKTRYLNANELSQELSKQVAVRKEQYQREREADQLYFSEVVLKDVKKYHHECEEKEKNKLKSNQVYRELLGKQKRVEARVRTLDQRESEMTLATREREKYDEEEKKLREKKKIMQLKYRSELLQQIKEQQRMNAPESDDMMTSAEKSINHRELLQLQNDPIKYEKVKQMLGVYAPQSSISSASTQSPIKRGRRVKGLQGVVS